MALDFYDISDIHLTNRLFKIDDMELDTLAKVFQTLLKKNSLVIDLYGKTRIYPNKIAAFANELKSFLDNGQLEKERKANLLELYRSLLNAHTGLIAVGD